ncbi:MAG: hypothetical protein ACLP6G_16655 [Terriglobales bacterium]
MWRMKRMGLTLGLGLFLFVVRGSAQTLVDKPYLVRAETTVFDSNSGMTHICILVTPDGHYRRERSFQALSVGTPYTRVWVDALPEASVKELEAILDEAKFQNIRTPQAHGGIFRYMDTLGVTVPREHYVQNIIFMNSADRKPYDKDLKAFLNWMKDIEKRKMPEAKGEGLNNCAAPMVQFRTGLPPPELEEKPKPQP